MTAHADIAGLQELATKFTTTGNNYSERAAGLVQRANNAISKFEETLDSLYTSAGQYNDATVAKMEGLSRDSDGTEWTGLNRDGFNTDKGNYQKAINDAVTKIGEDIETIKSEVRTKFAGSITDMNTQVTAFKDSVTETATNFSTSTTNQEVALEQAGNMGWTAV